MMIYSDKLVTTPNHLKAMSGNGSESGCELVTIATNLLYNLNPTTEHQKCHKPKIKCHQQTAMDTIRTYIQ